MKKELAAPNIDFADSSYQSFQMIKKEILIVSLSSWQDIPLKLTFKNIIQFSYKIGSRIQDLYEILESTAFLQEALEREYEKIPDDHPYRLFQLEDIDDFPFIQVVAESVEVMKE